MASSEDRFTFEIVHVLQFRNGLNEELCCRFIFINLQQSLDLSRCDQKFQSPIWRLIKFRIWSPKCEIQSYWHLYQVQFYALFYLVPCSIPLQQLWPNLTHLFLLFSDGLLSFNFQCSIFVSIKYNVIQMVCLLVSVVE